MKNIVDFTSKIKEKFTMRKDIAPVEESSTASRAYSAGDKFYYGNLLQKAITDIAQGAAFVGGTNFENADPVTTTIQNLTNQVNDNINILGAKNLLPFDMANAKVANTSGTWSGNAYTHNGVTFTPTFDSEGNLLYIDVDGTATPYQALFYIWSINAGDIMSLPSGNYIVNGCPAGGTINRTYKLDYAYQRSGAITYNTDYGNGVEVALENDDKLHCYITIANNYTVSHLKFYPMIRLASDTDPTYEPYAKTNQQLTKETTGLIDNVNANGAKNLLPFDLAIVKALNPSGTWSGNSYTFRGITFTPVLDDDGNLLYINLDGTSNANSANFLLCSNKVLRGLPAGSYILSGCPAGGAYNKYRLRSQLCDGKESTTPVSPDSDYGQGRSLTFESGGYLPNNYHIYIEIWSGQSFSNAKACPMIRLASDTDPTYEPYAKTNQQLTRDKVGMDLLSEVGAVNYCQNLITTQTVNGVTVTVNDDYSITCTGSVNANTGNNLYAKAYMTVKVPKGTYKYSTSADGKSGIGNSNLYICVDKVNGETGWYRDYAADSITVTTESYIRLSVGMKNDTNTAIPVNVTFYPMLSPVDYTGSYVPYAKTNKELTEDVADLTPKVDSLYGGQLNDYVKVVGQVEMKVFCTSDAIPSDYNNLTTQEATDFAQAIYDLLKKLGAGMFFMGIVTVGYYKKSDGTFLGSGKGFGTIYTNVPYNSMLSNNNNARMSVRIQSYGNSLFTQYGLWGKTLTYLETGVSAGYLNMDTRWKGAYNTISTYVG